MQNRFVGLTLLLVSLGFTTTGVQAEPVKPKESHCSIPRLLRDQGFKHKTATWSMTMTETDENQKTRTWASKVWLSGNQYCLESVDQQDQKAMRVIDDGQHLYLYRPAEKKAFQVGPEIEALMGDIFRGDLVAQAVRQRKQIKPMGSETLDGRPCDIYEYPQTLTMMNNEIKSQVKEWVWTEEQLPLQSVVKTPKHNLQIVFVNTEVPATETQSRIKDVVFDQPVDTSFFKLPAGTKVEAMEKSGPMHPAKAEVSTPGPALNANSVEPGTQLKAKPTP